MTRAPLLIVLLAMPTALVAAQPMAASGAAGAQPQQLSRSAAASIGRLFYTPAERVQLDIARRAKPIAPTPQAEAPPAPQPPQVVSYGGIIRRSDGKAMLWINNRLVEEKEALAGLNLQGKVRRDGAVTLQVPETGGSIEVKVGQSVEVHTGRVAETRNQREAAVARDAANAAAADASTAPDKTAPAGQSARSADTGPPAPAGAPQARTPPAAAALPATPNAEPGNAVR